MKVYRSVYNPHEKVERNLLHMHYSVEDYQHLLTYGRLIRSRSHNLTSFENRLQWEQNSRWNERSHRFYDRKMDVATSDDEKYTQQRYDEFVRAHELWAELLASLVRPLPPRTLLRINAEQLRSTLEHVAKRRPSYKRVKEAVGRIPYHIKRGNRVWMDNMRGWSLVELFIDDHSTSLIIPYISKAGDITTLPAPLIRAVNPQTSVRLHLEFETLYEWVKLANTNSAIEIEYWQPIRGEEVVLREKIGERTVATAHLLNFTRIETVWFNPPVKEEFYEPKHL